MISEKGKGEGGRKTGNEEETNREGNAGKSRAVLKPGACQPARSASRLPGPVAMATEHCGGAVAGAQATLPSRARARKALGDDRPPRSSLAARRGHRL